MLKINQEVINNFVVKINNKANVSHGHNSHISYGQVDSTSTSTAFTATVNGLTELTDGTTVMLRNGRVTSAAGFTLNVNQLGAKPVYNSMADATADTTIFNINYTMLFVYDSVRVTGGCWICYRGYNSDNNTIGYQLRTNSSVFTTSDKGYRYRLWLQCLDGKLMPVNTSTSTNATAKRDSAMNTRKFVLGGKIVYNSTKADYNADDTLPATTLWQQYNFTFGYSFNNTGSALTLTPNAPIYMVCTDEGDGLGKLASPYYTQTLPNAVDNKLYVYLGMVTTATTVELSLEHPIFEYRNGGIGLWSNNGHSHTISQITDFPSTMTPSSHAHGNLQNDGSVGTSNNASKNVVTDSGGKITTEAKPTIPTKTSDLQNDSGFLTSHQDISGKEDTSNKVTSLSSSSTDTQYPSAKIVYDSLNDLHTSSIKIRGEPLTNIWTGAITEQATLNTFINNHIGEIDARLQKEEIVYGSIYNTDSSKVYISGTYNKVCESVNSQHPFLNEMILFKLPNDLNSSSTKSIRIKVTHYVNSYSSSTNSYELPVKYNNVVIKENTFASNTIILLKLNSSSNGFDVVGVFSPNSTGSYTDLTDKPTIPSKTSDLTNDSGFLTSHQSLANYVQKSSTTGLLKNDGSVDTTSYLSSLPSHTHTVSNITDFPSFKTINNESIVGTGNITISGGGSEAEFLTGSFSASSSYIIVANSSKSTLDDGDRFYVHITNTSTSTSNARLSVGYDGGNYYANGVIYDNYNQIQSNQIIADTIILVECSINNDYSWNVVGMWSYAPVNHNHTVSNITDATTVSVVVTYVDDTTETLTLLKQISS